MKNSFHKLQKMLIYCQKYKKYGDTFPKKLFVTSKNKIRRKAKCFDCLNEKSFIDKIGDYDLDNELEELKVIE